MSWFLYPLIAVNIFSFLIFGFDKFRALRHGRRVPEKTLFLVTFLAGSIGSLLGMYLFRHKTSKTSFQIVIALLVLVQLAIVAFVWQQIRP